MTIRCRLSARTIAGAFLLCASAAVAVEPIRIAAERPDATCPGRILGIVVAGEDRSLPADASHCVAILELSDLSPSTVDAGAEKAGKLPAVAAAIVQVDSPIEPASPDWPPRFSYAAKKLSSAIRGASPGAQVGYDLTVGIPADKDLTLPDLDLDAYIDAFVRRPGRGFVRIGDLETEWLLTEKTTAAASDVIRSFGAESAAGRSPTLIGLIPSGKAVLDEPDLRALERLQAYWTVDVSRDPTPTTARIQTGSEMKPIPVLRLFDAKKLTPLLFLPSYVYSKLEIELPPETYSRAAVENLETGARRDFPLKGGKTLALNPSDGALAVVLYPVSRGGETNTTVEVGATRGLTAEEIVARERAWDSAQREKTQSFIADMKTSLRFRIAEVNETFDLTIHGPFFYRSGQPGDWEWDEFYLNGVRWKGKTLPKLPILQPEKVTTLPLDIRLSEEYDYTLHGETTVSGRRAYRITFTPKSVVGEKPIYRGSVWIDQETFALLRRDSVQLNLKGETLSNVQTEYYRPLPGHPEVSLPLEIKGEQVFSTAGRTTAIERDVVLQAVDLNPQDFEQRREAAYGSQAQMIRDTDKGMRYLVPDPARPGQRVVEEKISKKSTFGLLGGFYDKSVSFPIPLAGVQYFNFDLWGKGKQLSVFFAGALLTANYTDPGLAGSRFDLGADMFGVAFASTDVSYRNGKEVTDERIKHIPALFQVNVGHPIGPYLKASIGLFTKWDNYQRDSDTGPNFVTPVDTFTDGTELRLVGNYSGFNVTTTGSYFRRSQWEPWGDPATSEYNPRQQDYWKYSFSISKDEYFPGFRKLHLNLSYLGGSDLDRFSKYEFGTFSGNPIRGYQSGSLRTQNALVANVSYGLNIEDIIRFEGFYDQALLKDRVSGFNQTYFSGAGLLASLNGPWKNSLIRAEVGVPVVSHGIHGFVVNTILLKLF